MTDPGPCPSWCDRRHTGQLTSHSATRRMADGGTWASLLMNPADGSLIIMIGNHQLGKGSESTMVELAEAPHLAGVLGRLGHEDLAAAITELAALAGGKIDG